MIEIKEDGSATLTLQYNTSRMVVHDQAEVWGMFCLRQSTFVDGKQISEVYLPGPWFAEAGA